MQVFLDKFDDFYKILISSLLNLVVLKRWFVFMRGIFVDLE